MPAFFCALVLKDYRLVLLFLNKTSCKTKNRDNVIYIWGYVLHEEEKSFNKVFHPSLPVDYAIFLHRRERECTGLFQSGYPAWCRGR